MSSILGISALYHDSAAALVVDGEIVAAAQEERFTRIKHDDGFPIRASHAMDPKGLRKEVIEPASGFESEFEEVVQKRAARRVQTEPRDLR